MKPIRSYPKCWPAMHRILALMKRKAVSLVGFLCSPLLFLSAHVNPKKAIIFSFQGDYACNPKYIAQELLRMDSEITIVLAAKESVVRDRRHIPQRIKVVRNRSVAFYRELYSAGVWVTNATAYFRRPLLKRKKQVIIQTWHGSFGLKRFYDAGNSGSAYWRRWAVVSRYFSRHTDICISNSAFETQEVYRDTFWPHAEIWEIGHPRNDLLLTTDAAHRDALKKSVLDRYGIRADARLVLYAPTFRDNLSFAQYALSPETLKAFSGRFGGEWVMLIRYHPRLASKEAFLQQRQQAVNVSDYVDIQELLLVCDAAITDYSSWIFDFLLTKNPAFIFATDLDRYSGQERSFFYPITDTPFPIACSNESLVENIIAFDETAYRAAVDRFLTAHGSVESGTAAHQAAERILRLMKG